MNLPELGKENEATYEICCSYGGHSRLDRARTG